MATLTVDSWEASAELSQNAVELKETILASWVLIEAEPAMDHFSLLVTMAISGDCGSHMLRAEMVKQ